MDLKAPLGQGAGIMKLPGINVILKLARVSNLPTVWANCIAGWVLGGGEFSDVFSLAVLVIGASLAYSAGMIMNDALDVEADTLHRPDRPLPSGDISLNMVWGLSIAFLSGGVVLMLLAGSSPGLALLLASTIVGYNVLHKRWAGSVFLMGACRALLYLVAASVPEYGVWFREAVVIWAIALGIYTVGITLAARGEAEDKGTGHFGLSMLAVPLLAATATYFLRAESGILVIISLIAWAAWTAYSILLLVGDDEGRVSRAVALLIAGMLLIDAVAVSAAYPWLSAALMAGLPIVLVLQRRISAT